MRSSPYSRLLVLLDGTERGERALAWVRHLARGPGSVVHLLMVEPAARALRAGGRTVWTHVRVGGLAQVTCAVIRELDADVLVLTDGVARLLPLHAVPIPVLMSGPRCRRSA
jgi:nucleotide-binding universal stress UspA family protein